MFVLALAVTPAFAQYGGGVDIGRTILHRYNIAVADSATTTGSLELAGYNRVRADYDVTGSDVSINVDLQCSNDTLWVSGDSITITADSWDEFDLMGCKDYNFYIESVEGVSTELDIYVTGYNRKN